MYANNQLSAWGINMKQIIVMLVVIFYTGAIYAECKVQTTTYTSCKPGYYLSSGNCVACPKFTGVTVNITTKDKNTGDATSCYIPSGSEFSDFTGSGKFTADCKYSK